MSIYRPKFIKEWNQIRKEEGIKELLKQKGFIVLVVFFMFYLVRDIILYILIPYFVIKGIFPFK
jgi:hypothetical protein